MAFLDFLAKIYVFGHFFKFCEKNRKIDVSQIFKASRCRGARFDGFWIDLTWIGMIRSEAAETTNQFSRMFNPAKKSQNS